jgi:hypothetical protein
MRVASSRNAIIAVTTLALLASAALAIALLPPAARDRHGRTSCESSCAGWPSTVCGRSF